LKIKKTTGLESACARSLNQVTANKFFDMLANVVKEHNILPENLYNIDEKGI